LLVWIVLLGSMAEPSLLCVNCLRPPPPHRRTWGRCTVCIERNLPSTYYCGEECMNAHWQNGHKVYHKVQKQMAKERLEGTGPDRTRSLAEAEARRAEATGSEYQKRFAAALALNAQGDHNAAAKAWRKTIKEWPELPGPYHNLAIVLQRSGRFVEAAQTFFKAMELYEDGTKGWAEAAALWPSTFKSPDCSEAPEPEWWDDEAVKALSAQVVAVSPDGHMQCAMRARVLIGGALAKAPWNAGPRTAAEVKEAASCYRRAARVCHLPADKLVYEQCASGCDEYANPLLAKEEAAAAAARAAAEAEAEKARAAAEAEAAKTLKVAEAKATAAAKELLAEEEKEKQQASTKAGKSKQSKGKGKR